MHRPLERSLTPHGQPQGAAVWLQIDTAPYQIPRPFAKLPFSGLWREPFGTFPSFAHIITVIKNKNYHKDPSMNLQALMMMFPVVFMFHDFEELCFLESWIRKNADFLRAKSAGKNWLKLEVYPTSALGITIMLMFWFVSATSILCVVF